MKKSRTAKVVLFILAALFAFGCVFPSCSKDVGLIPTGREVIENNTAEYDNMVAMTRAYQGAVAKCGLTTNNLSKKMTAIAGTVDKYGAQVTENTEAWTGNFKPAQDALETQLTPYLDAVSGDGTIDPSKIDLAKLQEMNAMPDQLASGLNLYFNAVTQAPPPEVDSAVYMKMIDIQSESYDTMTYACQPVNEAAEAYNTLRAQVKGEIVTAVSEFVGFPLPESLPYYVGGGDGPMTAPTPFE